MNFFTNSFFDNLAPQRRETQRCCNDPYCENNRTYTARRQKPEKRSTFDKQFDFDWNTPFQSFNRDPIFNNGFSSSFFQDEDSHPTQNRRVRTARTKPQNEPVQARKNYKNAQEDLKRSSFEQFDNKESQARKNYRNSQQDLKRSTFEQFDNKENQAPKFYSTKFQSNSVNQNGKTTTINKEQYKNNEKSETFVTKITEDKEGKRNIEKLNPNNYSTELKALLEEMEETGAILMEINPQSETEEDSNSVKMLEENSHSFRSLSGDKISNTKEGNNMF